MPILKLTALIAVLLISSVISSACTGDQSDPLTGETVFRHDFADSASPWTNTDFDAGEEKFTFAIFSDLTGSEREHVFEIALAQIALLRPEFIVNVGDLIEGGTTDRGVLKQEWDSFDQRARKATAPVFYTGGNHDLTNMTMRDVWQERYGKRYYHFVYKDVLFLVLDTEDYPSEKLERLYVARAEAMQIAESDGWGAFGKTEYANMPEQKTGEIGKDQAAYFEKVIADNADVRWTFVLLHKPAWRQADEQNFALIENALSDRDYTVFGGHFHFYLHEKRYGRDYIQLGTSGGVQFPDRDLSIDHVVLVTVSARGVDIANLRMSGIFDKTGHIPLGGDRVCFDLRQCSGDRE